MTDPASHAPVVEAKGLSLVFQTRMGRCMRSPTST
jgi:hypothetical protein